jgi:ubiquinone/menaquinone biosynthesis C-methylase UbiE
MPNFNRVAGVYNILKKIVFGNQLDEATQFFLNQIPENSTILLIGGGDGRLLQKIASTNQIVYVEQSSAMIRKAKKTANSSQITFVTADILNWESDQRFNVIITPFVLDCFSESQLHLIFEKIDLKFENDGIWIQTDFYPKNKWQNSLVKVMYYFFSISAQLRNQELPDFDRIFKKYGFSFTEKASFYHSMVESKIYRKIE